jgi:hypothetical protein
MMMFFAVWDLPTLANIIAAAAVVLGVPFALLQLHYANRTRSDTAAVDIVRTVQSQEVRRAVERVLRLPDDADPNLVRTDPAMLDAALAVDSACEMWGCMVFEGLVRHHVLDRMVGGCVRGTWRRSNKWVEAERSEKRNANVAEWWQWLYELLERDPDPGKAQGAHVAYRGMKRRR